MPSIRPSCPQRPLAAPRDKLFPFRLWKSSFCSILPPLRGQRAGVPPPLVTYPDRLSVGRSPVERPLPSRSLELPNTRPSSGMAVDQRDWEPPRTRKFLDVLFLLFHRSRALAK